MIKIPVILRRSAAAVLAVVLLAALLSSSAFAFDFDFTYDLGMDDVFDEYTSTVGSILEDTYTALQWSLEEELSYETEKIFEEFIVLKTHAERVKYFFALPEYQRALLIQYIRYLTELGYFDGNYYYDEDTSGDFVEDSFGEGSVLRQYSGTVEEENRVRADRIVYSIPRYLTDIVKAAVTGLEEGSVSSSASDSASSSSMSSEERAYATSRSYLPQLSDSERQFYYDYEHYINLYRQYGSYGDYSALPGTVYQDIVSFVETYP